MTREEKQLLLIDLCARLPYGVICTDGKHGDSKVLDIIDINSIDNEVMVYCFDFDEYIGLEDCKPYLRPMSSMTKEEMEVYSEFFNYDGIEYPSEYVDWLNKKMFDYRGLIKEGLALEAPEDMYNFNRHEN